MVSLIWCSLLYLFLFHSNYIKATTISEHPSHGQSIKLFSQTSFVLDGRDNRIEVVVNQSVPLDFIELIPSDPNQSVDDISIQCDVEVTHGNLQINQVFYCTRYLLPLPREYICTFIL